MRKRLAALFFAVLLFLSFPFTAGALTMTPYLGYEYNSAEESVPAPVGYVPEGVYYGADMGTSALSAPADLCFYKNELYLLDSGNSRILVTDESLRFKRAIGKIKWGKETLDYTGAQGLYVCADGNLLIADTQNSRVIEVTNSGSAVQVLSKPDTSMIDSAASYHIKKVIRDTNGVTYALVDGVNDGAVTYLSDGSFGGFFAGNEVEKTAAVIFNYMWKRFMTEEQIRNSKTASPASITNFDIAGKGFLYTVTQSTDGSTSVRLLNFKGSNLEEETEFGDLEWDRKIKNSVTTSLCDVDVDDDEFIYLLDTARGRVFVYTKDGDLITVFGGLGEQTGLLNSAAALETHGEKVYVLDDVRGSVTVYRQNEYLATVKTAANLLKEGKYSESKGYWEKVLAVNSNSTIAYDGIGLALDESGDYRQALRYYKLAYDHENYSRAFKEVRREFVKEHFLLFMAALALLIAGGIVSGVFLRKKLGRKNAYERSALESKFSAPLFTLFHPIDGFTRLKKEKKWSFTVCVVLLIGLFLTLTMRWFLTGFCFNMNRAVDYNLFVTLLQAVLIVSTAAIANWAVCTLIDGKGKLVDIFGTMIYSLLPLILSILLYVLLSRVLCLEEEAFLNVITVVGWTWTGIIMFVGFMTIHEFSFRKTVLSVIMTFLGIAVIIFLAILFAGLVNQVVSFVKSIVSEAVVMGS